MANVSVDVRVKTLLTAIERGMSVDVSYTKEGASASRDRIFTPSHVFESEAGHLCVRGYDSYRERVITLRLDRMDRCRLYKESDAFTDDGLLFPASYNLRLAAPYAPAPDKVESYLEKGWSRKPLASVLTA